MLLCKESRLEVGAAVATKTVQSRRHRITGSLKNSSLHNKCSLIYDALYCCIVVAPFVGHMLCFGTRHYLNFFRSMPTVRLVMALIPP